MNRHNRSEKPDWVPPRSVKLPDQVCERIRYLNHSIQIYCGSGLRLREALGLRIKDVDIDRHAVNVRSGKGDKERVVMLPRGLVPSIRHPLVA